MNLFFFFFHWIVDVISRFDCRWRYNSSYNAVVSSGEPQPAGQCRRLKLRNQRNWSEKYWTDINITIFSLLLLVLTYPLNFVFMLFDYFTLYCIYSLYQILHLLSQLSLVSIGVTMTEYGISNPLLATDVVLSRPNACMNVSCCVQNQFRSSPGMYSKIIK